MSASELLGRLTDTMPDVEPVIPAVFVDDDLLPAGLTLIEPTAFVLAYSVAAWGPRGPRN